MRKLIPYVTAALLAVGCAGSSNLRKPTETIDIGNDRYELHRTCIEMTVRAPNGIYRFLDYGRDLEVEMIITPEGTLTRKNDYGSDCQFLFDDAERKLQTNVPHWKK